MFKRKHRKEGPVKVYMKDIREMSKNSSQEIDLYQVTGVAPTYTFPHNDEVCGRQTWSNVFMTWWVIRSMPFRVNYGHIFGNDEFSEEDMLAVNQMWLLEEAELYKKWIDNLYPEEETKITKIEYPYKPHNAYRINFDGVKGSLWSAHPFWHYAWRVCYYIDTTNCKKLN